MSRFEEMGDTKAYCLFVLVLFGIGEFATNFRTIFPIMDYDEYFVDKYGTIHNKNCPYKSVPWFTKKEPKYDIMRKKGQRYCNECVSAFDEGKMEDLHLFNVENRMSYLRSRGATQEYIDKELNKYADD